MFSKVTESETFISSYMKPKMLFQRRKRTICVWIRNRMLQQNCNNRHISQNRTCITYWTYQHEIYCRPISTSEREWNSSSTTVKSIHQSIISRSRMTIQFLHFKHLRFVIKYRQQKLNARWGLVCIILTTHSQCFLWSPYVIGQTIIFSSCSFFLLLLLFFSSPNLSGRRSDVCHTSTHGVALVRI